MKYAREKWHLSPSELDTLAGIESGTVPTLEAGTRTLGDATARLLADAMQVRADWLLTGDDGMVWLSQMTIAAQSEAQSGPGTEGLPNNVNSGAGPGHRDDAGEWQVEQGESNHAANSTLTP